MAPANEQCVTSGLHTVAGTVTVTFAVTVAVTLAVTVRYCATFD